MKISLQIILLLVFFTSCRNSNKAAGTILHVEKPKQTITGTWKLVYGEIKEEDSIQVKDLSKSDFLKIINADHFAFFNQPKNGNEGFYGAGGTYILDGKNYSEVLKYSGSNDFRGQEFSFTVEFKGDTLIQSGIENIPEAGIKRYILEKYLRVNVKEDEKL